MKRLFILFFTCLFAVSLTAQQDTAFIYTFGGEQDEQGRDIELTADSGFIMVGATSSFGNGNSDIYLVKVDSNIKYQWSRAIGHFHLEFGHAVKQTKDGGYVICGYSNSKGNGSYDGYLVRTDDTGSVVWEKYYGGFDWDKFYDVELTPDGGFMLVGETNSFGAGDADAWIVKTDSLGNLEWEKFLGGKKKDIAHALISTKDGNYAFCGENASKNDTTKGDAWLVKFDGTGKVVFDVTHEKVQYDYCKGLTETKNNGFALIGTSFSWNYPKSDIYLVKFDKNGVFNWDYNHGLIFPPNVANDVGNDVKEYPNENLLIIGTSILGNEGKNFYTGMVSPTGDYITAPSYGLKDDDIGERCLIHPIKGEVFFGTTNFPSNSGYTDFMIVKVDTVDGNKYHKTKVDVDISLDKPLGERLVNATENKITVFPVPTGNIVNLSQTFTGDLMVYNSQGKIVLSKMDYSNSILDISELSSGIYYVKFKSKDTKFYRKIIKQ
mgnify:CR=1 FL=1